MILSINKLAAFTGILLLSLASCETGPQPAEPPNAVSSTESTPAASTPESTPETTLAIAPGPAESGGDIWSQLRRAETHYYLLMRHAIAPGTGDPPNFQLDDCSTQRNLSKAGITQAIRTGNTFKEQRVAVKQVLSSQWCRCLDTAMSMDLGPVEPFPALNSFFTDRAKEPERTEALREFMVTRQDEPGVTVLVTHFVNIVAISGDGVASGEIVVIQVNDQNEPEVVAKIEPF